MNRRELLVSIPGLGLASVAYGAKADDYPSKPIRFVVAFTPGGGADISSRIISTRASQLLGNQIVVDNRPGAGANIAAEVVAKARPDGYTLLHTTVAHAIGRSLYKDLRYDYLKDFAPVAPLGSSGFVLAVNKDLPVKSVKELIAYANDSKRELDYGSSGNGGPGHLATELFKSITGVRMQHVPYKGISPAITDLIGGRIQVSFITLPAALSLMRSGEIVGLGLSSAQRSSLVPDLPTIAETGVSGFEAETWYGALAPTGTPEAILDRLHEVFAQTLRQPEVTDKLKEQGFDLQERSRAEFGAYMRSETEKWTKVVEATHAKID